MNNWVASECKTIDLGLAFSLDYWEDADVEVVDELVEAVDGFVTVEDEMVLLALEELLVPLPPEAFE